MAQNAKDIQMRELKDLLNELRETNKLLRNADFLSQWTVLLLETEINPVLPMLLLVMVFITAIEVEN